MINSQQDRSSNSTNALFAIPDQQPPEPNHAQQQERQKLQMARCIKQAYQRSTYQGRVTLDQILAMSFERVHAVYNEIMIYYIQHTTHNNNNKQQTTHAHHDPNALNPSTTNNVNKSHTTHITTFSDAQHRKKHQMARNITQAYQGRVTLEQVLAMSLERVQRLHNEVVSRLNQSSTTSNISAVARVKPKMHKDKDMEDASNTQHNNKQNQTEINEPSEPSKSCRKKTKKKHQTIRRKTVKHARNIYARYATKPRPRTTWNSIKASANTPQNVCLRRKDILSSMKVSEQVDEGMGHVLYSTRKGAKRRRRRNNINKNVVHKEIKVVMENTTKESSDEDDDLYQATDTHSTGLRKSVTNTQPTDVVLYSPEPPLHAQTQSKRGQSRVTNRSPPVKQNDGKKRAFSHLDDITNNMKKASNHKRLKVNMNSGKTKTFDTQYLQRVLEDHFGYTQCLQREIKQLKQNEVKLRNENRLYKERLQQFMDLIGDGK
eukprot:451330_1